MRLANHTVGQRAVKQHLRISLNDRLNLCLPLFEALKTGRSKPRENLSRTAGVAQKFIEAPTRGHAFATFTRDDECSARLNYPCAGAHAFDSLVKIQVEWVTAVRSHDDVERCIELLLRRFPHEFATDLMRGEQVTRENAGDLALLIQRNVQQKAQTG